MPFVFENVVLAFCLYRAKMYLSLSVFESSTQKHIYLQSYHNFTLNIYFYATMRANPQAKYDERNQI